MARQLLALSLLIFPSFAASAQEAITGSVSDSRGAPLLGATLVVEGTAYFAVTDPQGNFSLSIPAELPFTIVVNSVGYRQQEIVIYELPDEPLQILLSDDGLLDEIVVTARRRSESIQEVPIPVTVIGGGLIEDAGGFNVNRIKELAPTVQLYTSNPRNTTLNVRGLGSTFGLTNDGIDPGVGFYVDGVYFARPAVTTLDFIDVDQIEVLRGPQGTLFGKNTTAGAFNITSRKASFASGGSMEVSFGNYGFIQARAAITGPLSKKLAGRLSFSGTQRNGLVYNSRTQKNVNDMNNLGIRGQLLYAPNDKLEITLTGDASTQRPDGFAQVNAGVVRTLRPEYRQFEAIIAEFDYTLPYENPFDRKIDHDTPWRSGNDLGGVSVNVDAQVGPGTLTSTSAWRYWNWDPSNDRDFTGLQALALSQAPSKHDQWSQEFRYAGDISSKLSGVIGVFGLWQDLRSNDVHTEESGIHQWRFVQRTTSELWATPGLFDGYGIKTRNKLESFSGALFAQADWEITKKLHLLPGIRYNYDKKYVEYDRKTYGGLETDDPALIALQQSVYNDQDFITEAAESNLSGQLTLAYRVSERLNAFVTYSTNFKPVGVNLGGLPREAGRTMIELATIRPENVQHLELGVKTRPGSNYTINFTFFNTRIKDYQTLVQTPDLSVNRGYLANAEEVRVLGAELDGSIRFGKHVRFFGAVAYNDGKYASFTNAPPPLEETGGPSFKDISGGQLPGVSKWATSLSGEYTNPVKFAGYESVFFIAFDSFYRSWFSSSPSPSLYINVDGYLLLNGRIGFRSATGLSAFLWSRNLLNTDYFEFLLPGAGSVGNYAGVLGDPATYGATLRYNF